MSQGALYTTIQTVIWSWGKLKYGNFCVTAEQKFMSGSVQLAHSSKITTLPPLHPKWKLKMWNYPKQTTHDLNNAILSLSWEPKAKYQDKKEVQDQNCNFHSRHKDLVLWPHSSNTDKTTELSLHVGIWRRSFRSNFWPMQSCRVTRRHVQGAIVVRSDAPRHLHCSCAAAGWRHCRRCRPRVPH